MNMNVNGNVVFGFCSWQLAGGSHEKVADYATSLKKILKEAYPKESGVSTVLSQRFLAGLKPSIRKQVLLKGRPSTLDEAMLDPCLTGRYALAVEKFKKT